MSNTDVEILCKECNSPVNLWIPKFSNKKLDVKEGVPMLICKRYKKGCNWFENRDKALSSLAVQGQIHRDRGEAERREREVAERKKWAEERTISSEAADQIVRKIREEERNKREAERYKKQEEEKKKAAEPARRKAMEEERKKREAEIAADRNIRSRYIDKSGILTSVKKDDDVYNFEIVNYEENDFSEGSSDPEDSDTLF